MVTRRQFVKNVTASALSFFIVPRHVIGKGYVPPSDMVYIAGIGAGGRGFHNLEAAFAEGQNRITHLCDVDEGSASSAREKWSGAKFSTDFRTLLDREHRSFDAVIISTPDHNHAIHTISAIQLGKHVYTETPLAHDFYECNLLARASVKYKVAAQIGNQISSSSEAGLINRWIKANLIGDIAKVHLWANRPVGNKEVKSKNVIPKDLNWDAWLGTAVYHDFDPAYLNGGWKGWQNFGTGNLGANGSQMIGLPYSALNLDHTISVKLTVGSYERPEKRKELFPEKTRLSIMMARRDQGPPVEIVWYDGGYKPERPKELRKDDRFGDEDGGVLFEGTNGKLLAGFMGRKPRLLPDDLMSSGQKFQSSNINLSHQLEWINAIKLNKIKSLSSSFYDKGSVDESIALANILFKVPDNELHWDAQQMKFTNNDFANQFLKRDYREGYRQIG